MKLIIFNAPGWLQRDLEQSIEREIKHVSPDCAKKIKQWFGEENNRVKQIVREFRLAVSQTRTKEGLLRLKEDIDEAVRMFTKDICHELTLGNDILIDDWFIFSAPIAEWWKLSYKEQDKLREAGRLKTIVFETDPDYEAFHRIEHSNHDKSITYDSTIPVQTQIDRWLQNKLGR